MQTIPIATTTTGQGQPSAGPAAAGTAGPHLAGLFASLVQALAGRAQPAAPVAPGGGSAGAVATGDPATDVEAEAESAETGDEVAVLLPVPQPRALVDPVAAPAIPAPEGSAAAAPGPLLPQRSGEAPAAVSPPLAQPAPVAEPATAAIDVDPVPAPPAQAVELAKVLDAGTPVRVTGAAAEVAPVVPPVQGLAAVALAAAVEEAPPAAATAVEPARRRAPAEPRPAFPMTAGDGAAADGPAVAVARSAGPAEAAAPAANSTLADVRRATPAGPAAAGSRANAATVAEASASLADGTASNVREGQGQLPAAPAAGAAQPAAAVPERAQAAAAPVAPPPAGQVSVHIAKAVRSGLDRIHIQLEPASLGRVEVRLDLSDTGNVRASITAETAEALDLLRADARGLERALQDAGLKTDPGSLSFQLRDHGARAGHDGGSRQGHGAEPQARGGSDDAGTNPLAATVARAPAPSGAIGAGRIDIHA